MDHEKCPRIALLLYTTVLLVVEIISYSPSTLLYLTNLSWLGFVIYNSLSLIHQNNPHNSNSLSAILIDIIYPTIVTLPWVVSLTFWMLLSDTFINDNGGGKLESLNFHLLNLLIMITELVVYSGVLKLYGWIWPLICGYLYIGYLSLMHYTFNFDW